MESGPVSSVSSLNAHDVPTPLSATSASSNAMLSFFTILTPCLALPTPAEGPRVQCSIELLRSSAPAWPGFPPSSREPPHRQAVNSPLRVTAVSREASHVWRLGNHEELHRGDRRPCPHGVGDSRRGLCRRDHHLDRACQCRR